jgi:hypothetical protein
VGMSQRVLRIVYNSFITGQAQDELAPRTSRTSHVASGKSLYTYVRVMVEMKSFPRVFTRSNPGSLPPSSVTRKTSSSRCGRSLSIDSIDPASRLTVSLEGGAHISIVVTGPPSASEESILQVQLVDSGRQDQKSFVRLMAALNPQVSGSWLWRVLLCPLFRC